MVIYHTIQTIQNWRKKINKKLAIGFVPTMGSLHKGHIKLIQKSKSNCDITVVSIFVNPIQFNNSDDLQKYPSDFKKDKEILIKEKVDVLFYPSVKEVFSNGFPEIQFLYPKLMNKLCGASRKGHFQGILFIIYKLFLWISPTISFFGLKDYQQYLLICNMVKELEMNIKIIPVETIREESGIAYSSRNARLSPKSLQYAKQIAKRLFYIKNLWENNQNTITKNLKKQLQKPIKKIKIEYANIYDAKTLLEIPNKNKIKNPSLIAIAGVIENVRLIDNIILKVKI